MFFFACMFFLFEGVLYKICSAFFKIFFCVKRLGKACVSFVLMRVSVCTCFCVIGCVCVSLFQYVYGTFLFLCFWASLCTCLFASSRNFHFFECPLCFLRFACGCTCRCVFICFCVASFVINGVFLRQ